MDPDHSLRKSILIAASFIALIWVLVICTLFPGVELYALGVVPRTWNGLSGILTAPLFHSSWQHALGNTLPLLLLGSLLIYGYPKSRWWTLAGIWLLSGMGVWLFARSSYHIGASGLAHGMFFFLFISGILRRDKRSAALLMVAFYMYGGMLLTILPRDPGVSFESHFFGAAAGTLCAYLFRNWDPKPMRKRYSWESSPGMNSAEEEEDPVIGDQWKS
jgi:membrane associated rhomboid family serine protease